MCKEVYTIFRQRRVQRKHTQHAKGQWEMTSTFLKSTYLEFYTGRAKYLILKITFSFIPCSYHFLFHICLVIPKWLLSLERHDTKQGGRGGGWGKCRKWGNTEEERKHKAMYHLLQTAKIVTLRVTRRPDLFSRVLGFCLTALNPKSIILWVLYIFVGKRSPS